MRNQAHLKGEAKRRCPALLFAAALLVGGPLTASPPSAHAESVMQAGNSILDVEANRGLLVRLDSPASDIFVANSQVADVQVKSPRLIYVFGKQVGETSIFVLDENENVVYSAEVNVTHNLERLNETIAQLVPDAPITIDSVNGMVILSGWAKTPEEAEVAERMVREVVNNDDKVINRISVSTPTQVNLRVKIAEVSRDVLKSLAFNWENSAFASDIFFGLATGRGGELINIIDDPVTGLPVKEFIVGPNGTNSAIGSVTGNHFDINGVIDALESEGFVTILAEPNITALSGETANFLAGGEFPIPIPQSFGNFTIEFKQFGVGLSFTPTVLSDNKINLKVAPEVSQLSSAGAISVSGISVPAVTTRRASTTLELGSGQSFAMAGLLQNSIQQDVSKFPGLADIPILGALFKSDSFRRQETELVILVTPYIVRPIDARQAVLPTDRLQSPSDPARYLRGETNEQVPAPAPTPADTGNGISLVGGAGFRIGK